MTMKPEGLTFTIVRDNGCKLTPEYVTANAIAIGLTMEQAHYVIGKFYRRQREKNKDKPEAERITQRYVALLER